MTSMVSVWQVRDFLTARRINKHIGYFFSQESAEEKLGWFFVNNCCKVERF